MLKNVNINVLIYPVPECAMKYVIENHVIKDVQKHLNANINVLVCVAKYVQKYVKNVTKIMKIFKFFLEMKMKKMLNLLY